MLKLFPNTSDVLEQIHICKTSVIAELTIISTICGGIPLMMLASGSSLNLFRVYVKFMSKI